MTKIILPREPIGQEAVQGTPEWLAMRRRYIMASDLPILMQVSTFKTNDGRRKTPYTLWLEKLNVETMSCNNRATQYGKMMEEPAKLVYESMVGDIFAPKVLFHKTIPYLGASLDGLNLDETRAVEIKNCNKIHHQEAKQGDVPECYYPQVQQQIDVVDLGAIDYFSFNSGEGVIVKVLRDEEYINEAHEVQAEFWDCLKSLKPPKMTEYDFVKKDQEWKALAEQVWTLRGQRKALKEEEDEIKREEAFLETQLKEACEGKNCVCDNYRYGFYPKKGLVDYKSIPELKGVNLDKYRKDTVKIWSLSVK